MTNEEIRIKIAQEKGWREAEGLLCPPEGDPRMSWAAEWDSHGIPHFMPDWPENIADAWELVEEMPFYQIYKSQLVTGQPYYGCMCFMRLPCDEDNPDYIGEAGAVPRAICLAWLAWDAARKAEK